MITAEEQRQRMDLYNKGYSDTEIANAIFSTRSNIWEWRHKYNLPPNYAQGGNHRKLSNRALPCRVCGGEPYVSVYRKDRSKLSIYCQKCGLRIDMTGRDKAFEIWNRRANE